MEATMNPIELRQIRKIYRVGDLEVPALRGLDLTVERGEFVAIMGASGSGKSTLMNIIGCLDQASSGSFQLEGIQLDQLTPRNLAEIRNQKIGFVFQGYNLLARTSALENVELPLLYDRRDKRGNPRKKAEEALKRVGLGERMDHEPSQLSGGQQQRVAIARALVNEPAILLADEPTGNLDTRTSLEVMSLFQALNDQGLTIILVTHEHDIAGYAKRKVVLQDGLKIRDQAITDRHDAMADLAHFTGPGDTDSQSADIEQEMEK
jgi:putative ABC transport system ATP-binding protein